jgi:hypothetical protein
MNESFFGCVLLPVVVIRYFDVDHTLLALREREKKLIIASAFDLVVVVVSDWHFVHFHQSPYKSTHWSPYHLIFVLFSLF